MEKQRHSPSPAPYEAPKSRFGIPRWQFSNKTLLWLTLVGSLAVINCRNQLGKISEDTIAAVKKTLGDINENLKNRDIQKVQLGPQEDGIDNDFDGLIDAQDPDDMNKNIPNASMLSTLPDDGFNLDELNAQGNDNTYSTFEMPKIPRPDLSAQIYGPQIVKAGNLIVYSIQIDNRGNKSLDGKELVIDFPDAFVFKPNLSYAGMKLDGDRSVTFKIPTMHPSQRGTIAVAFEADENKELKIYTDVEVQTKIRSIASPEDEYVSEKIRTVIAVGE